MILMICDVVRVCVRPVSPVTTHHELFSVSSNPTEYDTPPCEGHPTNPCVGWLPLFCLAGKNLESEDHITNKIQQPRLSVVPVTMGK